VVRCAPQVAHAIKVAIRRLHQPAEGVPPSEAGVNECRTVNAPAEVILNHLNRRSVGSNSVAAGKGVENRQYDCRRDLEYDSEIG
jgi:hypothetical protein